jgi:hypothetical protein
VHSVVSQEVIASYAQKLNLHAVCERAASGQLLFLGFSSALGASNRSDAFGVVFEVYAVHTVSGNTLCD